MRLSYQSYGRVRLLSSPSLGCSVLISLFKTGLQTESQMLTRRLSNNAIPSADYSDAVAAAAGSRNSTKSPTGYKPSSIPRPSFSQEKLSQAGMKSPTVQSPTPSSKTPPVKRARTNSTPQVVTPRRPSIPLASSPEERPTRIPKVTSARIRSGSNGASTSSKTPNGKTNGKHFESPPSPDPTAEGLLAEARSRPYIRDEEPPFPPGSAASNEFTLEQTRLMVQASALPRPSTDSAERPFEHWYRGESARNGGVGELKIGRAEMLDIAQFGHARSAAGLETTGGRGRRRAGSVDLTDDHRESWIMDEATAAAHKFSKVMDESPLTDIDQDEYTTEGERDRPSNFATKIALQHWPPAASNVRSGPSTSHIPIPGSTTHAHVKPSSIPQPRSRSTTLTKRQQSAPPAAGSKVPTTPTSTNGSKATTPTSAKASGSKNKKGVKVKTPGNRSQGPSSPTTPTAASPPDDEEVDPAEAGERIPYMRPPSRGNWDDIVLPAVTKKMGIPGYGLKGPEGGIIELTPEERRKRMSMGPPPVCPFFNHSYFMLT